MRREDLRDRESYLWLSLVMFDAGVYSKTFSFKMKDF